MAAARNEWLVALCSAVFDIDEGQKLETTYPSAALSEEEAKCVAFHAFPVGFSCTSPHPLAQPCALFGRVMVLWLAYLQDSLSQELRSRSSLRDR